MRSDKRNAQLRILIFAALAALLLFSPAARADGLVVSLQPGVTASAGSSGSAFDVLLTNTGASSETVAGFSFEITTSDTDISFTGADTSTADPYIFADDSLDDINGFTLYSNTLPDQTVDASDFSNSGAGDDIAAGETVALGSILFDVAPDAAPGVFAATFDGSFISFSDPSGNSLPFAADNGTITITPGTASMPEPSTAELMIFAVAFTILFRRWRRSAP